MPATVQIISREEFDAENSVKNCWMVWRGKRWEGWCYPVGGLPGAAQPLCLLPSDSAGAAVAALT